MGDGVGAFSQGFAATFGPALSQSNAMAEERGYRNAQMGLQYQSLQQQQEQNRLENEYRSMMAAQQQAKDLRQEELDRERITIQRDEAISAGTERRATSAYQSRMLSLEGRKVDMEALRIADAMKRANDEAPTDEERYLKSEGLRAETLLKTTQAQQTQAAALSPAEAATQKAQGFEEHAARLDAARIALAGERTKAANEAEAAMTRSLERRGINISDPQNQAFIRGFRDTIGAKVPELLVAMQGDTTKVAALVNASKEIAATLQAMGATGDQALVMEAGVAIDRVRSLLIAGDLNGAQKVQREFEDKAKSMPASQPTPTPQQPDVNPTTSRLLKTYGVQDEASLPAAGQRELRQERAKIGLSTLRGAEVKLGSGPLGEWASEEPKEFELVWRRFLRDRPDIIRDDAGKLNPHSKQEFGEWVKRETDRIRSMDVKGMGNRETIFSTPEYQKSLYARLAAGESRR